MVRDIPLDVILSWPKPNLVDPETRGSASLVINIVLLSIVIPVVGIRIYTRHYMRHWLGWDDFFCVLALFLNIVFAVCVIVENYVFKCTRHVWDIPLNTLSQLFQLAMVCKLLFTIAGTAIRQSLLCFYLRLLGDAGIRWFRWVIHAATIFNVLIGLIFGVLSVVQCDPISAYWKFPSSTYGKCVNEGALTLASGVIIAFCDFLVVLLPIPIILKLQMTWRSKLGVVCLLSLGMAASAVAVVRTYYVWKALIDSYDTTWWAYPLYIAASVEINVAIICACVPAIRPWIAEHVPWLIQPIHWLSRLRYNHFDNYTESTAGAGQRASATLASHNGTRGNAEEKSHEYRHVGGDLKEIPLLQEREMELGYMAQEQRTYAHEYADMKDQYPATHWYETQVQDDSGEPTLVFDTFSVQSIDRKKSTSSRKIFGRRTSSSTDPTLLSSNISAESDGKDQQALKIGIMHSGAKSRNSSGSRRPGNPQRGLSYPREQRLSRDEASERTLLSHTTPLHQKSSNSPRIPLENFRQHSVDRTASLPRGTYNSGPHELSVSVVEGYDPQPVHSTLSSYRNRQTHAGIGSIEHLSRDVSYSGESGPWPPQRSNSDSNQPSVDSEWTTKRRQSRERSSERTERRNRSSHRHKQQSSFLRSQDSETSKTGDFNPTRSFDEEIAKLPLNMSLDDELYTSGHNRQQQPPRAAPGQTIAIPLPTMSRPDDSRQDAIRLPASRYQKRRTESNQPGHFVDALQTSTSTSTSPPVERRGSPAHASRSDRDLAGRYPFHRDIRGNPAAGADGESASPIEQGVERTVERTFFLDSNSERSEDGEVTPQFQR